MFARHLLMTTTSIPTGPQWQVSDVGLYSPSTLYELDRANRIYYRTTGSRPTYATAGTVGTDGKILVVNTPSGGTRRISLFATDKTGPIGAPLANYAPPTGTLWKFYGRAALVSAPSGSAFNGNLSYALTHVDIATGTRYPMGSIQTYGLGDPGALNTGDDCLALTGSFRGTFLGYKQGSSNEWAQTLQGNGPRASRAYVPRQVYDEAGVAAFWRMRADATPERVHLLPWRRPLTADTRVRAYSLQIQYETVGSSNLMQSANRRGRLYCGAYLTVHEIELGPSTGSGTLGGQAVTKHRMTVHLTKLEGFIVIDKSSVRFIATAQASDDTGYDVAQYVNADGSPSSEFVMDGYGYWSYIQPQLVMAGATPIKVTVNNLLTAPYDARGGLALTSWNVLDLAGTFVRTGSFPPNYVQSGGGYSYSVILLASADLLMSPILEYGTGWGSFDLGTTWVSLTGWGPRGSTKPTAPRPPDLPAENTDLQGSAQPEFYT
ncbi:MULTISPECIES: hypothetical protein [Methylobacterium]|uniref:hypothetical protein n=1 Tax=Methylobacterium TaxID=407 RepID=UPI00272DFDDB|nr:hypothetical protein [Methylobacterium sp.]